MSFFGPSEEPWCLPGLEKPDASPARSAHFDAGSKPKFSGMLQLKNYLRLYLLQKN
jgi:hypothetical protein